MLISDIGDVLVATRPGAHHRALAELTGLPATEVQDAIETSGLPKRFERGELEDAAFALRLRHLLAAPQLRDADLRAAWNAVIGEPANSLVRPVTALAARRELVLASNTNPWHWPLVRERLAGAGLHVASVPVVLSYEVGYVKPDAGYFRALLRHIDDPHAAAFVDDKPGNVDAAREHGLDGWIHIDVGVTAARIEEIVGRHRR